MGNIGHADRVYLEGIQHALDPTVLGPLLDLVVIAMVSQQRLVSLFV
jgi:hypothetical protein